MTDRQAAEARDEQVAANTDREIWRKGDGDGNGMSYYEPSIHVTERGEIGISVGGNVFVRPVEEWHALADLAIAYERRLVDKGRYRSRATQAAVKYGGAKAILRNLPEPK